MGDRFVSSHRDSLSATLPFLEWPFVSLWLQSVDYFTQGKLIRFMGITLARVLDFSAT
jgi:hypothetical protein